MKRIGWCVLAAFLTVCPVPIAHADGTIALHPLDVPSGLPDPAAARARIEAAITGRLRVAGWTVVPSAESEQAWQTRVQAVGGFYDAFTGDTVRSKYDEVHLGALRELAARHGATAWLRPSVEVMVVEWKRGKARWDGVTEGVSPVGSGRVPALSLVIAVEDTSGTVTAEGRGGLQVLSKVKGGGRYQDVPPDKLLTDPKRLAKAVDFALAPLLGEDAP